MHNGVHVDSVHIGYSMHLGGTRDGQLCMDKKCDREVHCFAWTI
jgi:hypothetical protein